MSAVITTGITSNPSLTPLQVPPNGWNIDGLYFDAWLSIFHSNSLTVTQHPVETGANITDHSYVNPLRFAFQLGVSDSQVQGSVSNFSAAPTRAINAYTQLQNRLENRQPVRIVTKYGIYDSVLIESIEVSDDYTTKNVLIAQVNCVEILMADVRKVRVTARPQAVNQTNRGVINGAPLQSILSQFAQRAFGAPTLR